MPTAPALAQTMTIDEVLARSKTIPVVTLQDAQNAVPLARALARGGVGIVEFTLRTPAGLDAIARVAAEVPEIVVGAGTILSSRDLGSVIAAGAKFAVSPGATKDLLAAARDHPIAMLPGVVSPSEIMVALEWGYSVLKFFPAEPAGGVDALRALSGPFPLVRFCASGGITIHDAASYLKLPNVTCVAADWMTSKEIVDDHDWTRVEVLARQTVNALQSG